MAAPSCPAPPSRWKGPLATVFVCAHCSLTVVTGLAAVGLATVPPILGVSAVHVLVPALLLGGFALWLWTGRQPRSTRT